MANFFISSCRFLSLLFIFNPHKDHPSYFILLIIITSGTTKHLTDKHKVLPLISIVTMHLIGTMSWLNYTFFTVFKWQIQFPKSLNIWGSMLEGRPVTEFPALSFPGPSDPSECSIAVTGRCLSRMMKVGGATSSVPLVIFHNLLSVLLIY